MASRKPSLLKQAQAHASIGMHNEINGILTESKVGVRVSILTTLLIEKFRIARV